MTAYIIRRLLLIVPTIFGIMVIGFLITQLAPGGPVERVLSQLSGTEVGATARIGGSATGDFVGATTAAGGDHNSVYRGAQGLDPEFIEQLKVQFGFDRPLHERFLSTLWNYIRFDFGESYYRDVSVIDLIAEKLPVSISLGLWTTLITYLVSIPLGVMKAVHDGSRADIWTSAFIVVGYSIPGFLFAVLLIVLFAGGTFLDIFPLRHLTSEN
jgi:microcin C transport system permease protein